MPVQIGKKPDHDFTQPIRLLSDCHRRIEQFLKVLTSIATRAHGDELSPGQRLSLSTALQYFREAAPKHTADEELSLFPRLRAAGKDEVEKVLAQVDRLQAEHTRAGRLHQEVDALGSAWLGDGRLPCESAGRLGCLVQELGSIYRTHIEIEDAFVFPLAERVLAAASVREIGQEMAARRGIAPGRETRKTAGSILAVHTLR